MLFYWFFRITWILRQGVCIKKVNTVYFDFMLTLKTIKNKTLIALTKLLWRDQQVTHINSASCSFSDLFFTEARIAVTFPSARKRSQCLLWPCFMASPITFSLSSVLHCHSDWSMDSDCLCGHCWCLWYSSHISLWMFLLRATKWDENPGSWDVLDTGILAVD